MSAEVLVAPYLPLDRRVEIGAWELIPRNEITRDDVSEAWVLEQGRQLLNAYRTQRAAEVPFGAVIRARDGRVGDEVDRKAPELLRRALLAAVLEGNPSALKPEGERTGNEGHATVTSDNVLVYGHPLNEEVWVVDDWGLMAPRLVGGLKLGDPSTRFEGPGELAIPHVRTPLDSAYAKAVYAVIAETSESSRRLARALDWLDIAWRNTRALAPENRIIALRVGFEVLLAVGESTRSIREALSALLDGRDAPRRPREWRDQGRRHGPHELTETEWWFQRFSLLRNLVMHGLKVPPDAWEHNGVASPTAAYSTRRLKVPPDAWEHNGTNHIWIAEDVLRKAIRRTVEEAG